MSWARGEDGTDAQTGAFMVADFMLLIRGALTKRGGKSRKG